MFVISGCGGASSSDEIVPSADTALSEETERNSCLAKADELIQNGQYGEAMSLLKEEWRNTKDGAIDAKICEMYENNLLEDVTSTLKRPVAQSVIDGNGKERNLTKLDYTFSAIHNHNLKYDCYTWNDEYKLAYFCIVGKMPEFFQWANPEFQWKVEWLNSTYSEKSSYHECYVASGEKVDWFLKNVFNFQPSHTLNEEREGTKIYYSDNQYHLKAPGTGRGYPAYQVLFEKICSLGMNQYYFIYRKNCLLEDSEYSSELYYAVLEQKTVDGITFWSIIKTSDQPISLKELWEKQKQNM